MYGEKNLGAFDTYVTGNFEVDSEVWSDNESLAVKWSFHTSDKNTRLTFIVTTLIHSNGKILFYYEGISKGIKEMQRQLTFRGEIPCGNQNNRRISVFVPGRWIRNGTLVEYEFLGDCPKRNSIEECQDAKSSNEMCIWCESAHMCVTSNDNDIRDFKLNGCRVKNNLNVDAPSESTLNKQEKTNEELTEADLGNDSKKTTEKSGPHLTISNVSVLSKPTLIKQEVNTQAITETDLRNESMITTKTTESYLMISNVSVSRDSTFNKQKEIPKEIVETDLKNQNLTTETAEDNEQRKLLQYVHTIMPLFLLYIVTPIVVSFIVIGSGCILFLWLYRRKENDF
ncbi:hypothetical protein Smp_133400.1 [Schistosoma mansoni]|nr:hypothetical protein Smp_133400.1 [Schistosoma mansoni]|eukprot:XP_018646237.1 hypothetical protein Smp_133400.1 [Schistosoma mansoni]